MLVEARRFLEIDYVRSSLKAAMQGFLSWSPKENQQASNPEMYFMNKFSWLYYFWII